MFTRRKFIEISIGATPVLAASGLPAFAAESGVKFKVGVMDWNLRQEGKIEAIALARDLGFDWVQVRISRGTDKLPLSDPALWRGPPLRSASLLNCPPHAPAAQTNP